MRTRSRRRRRVEQLRYVAGRELTPDDGRALEHASLARPQPVEARSEQRPKRRGRLEQPGLSHVRNELLEEERISLGCRNQTTARLVVEHGIGEQVVDELVRLRAGERFQHEALCGRGEVGPLLAELFPGDADEQDRCVADGPSQMLDELE